VRRSAIGVAGCPCHRSHYDRSGRIRRGPALRNLDIPPYTFDGGTLLQVG